MEAKKLILTLYRQNHIRPDWQQDLCNENFRGFFAQMAAELAGYGIEFSTVHNDDMSIDVNSYADVLNAVRISSPADGLTSRCVGHVIGTSEHLDLMEDIRRAVTRVAFAPETVPPDDHNRRVCHNCGCGC